MEYLIPFLLLMWALSFFIKGIFDNSKEKNKQNNRTSELSTDQIRKFNKINEFIKKEKGVDNIDEVNGIDKIKLFSEYLEKTEHSNKNNSSSIKKLITNEKLLEKNLNWSIQKQRKIKNLSKRLRTTKNDIPTSIDELFALGEKNKINELELYNACKNDKNISRIMDKYNYTKTELEDLYSMIGGAGGGQLIKGVYLPVASLLTPHIFEYTIRKKDQIYKIEDADEAKKAMVDFIYKLIEYFDKNI